MTLTFAITHPESFIRMQAIKRLDAVLSDACITEESNTFALNSVSSILVIDDDPNVVEETLSVCINILCFYFLLVGL